MFDSEGTGLPEGTEGPETQRLTSSDRREALLELRKKGENAVRYMWITGELEVHPCRYTIAATGATFEAFDRHSQTFLGLKVSSLANS